MVLSNLPPGVTVNMIPGNRPEDIALDKLIKDSPTIKQALDELFNAIPKSKQIKYNKHLQTIALFIEAVERI